METTDFALVFIEKKKEKVNRIGLKAQIQQSFTNTNVYSFRQAVLPASLLDLKYTLMTASALFATPQ